MTCQTEHNLFVDVLAERSNYFSLASVADVDALLIKTNWRHYGSSDDMISTKK